MNRSVPWQLVLLLCAPALAGDFGEARKAFQAGFHPGASAGAREESVMALAAFDTKETAKLLLSGIPVSQEILESLSRRRAAVRAGRIKGFPDGDPRPELARLKDAIDAELLVLAALEKAMAGRWDERAFTFLCREALSREKHWKVRQVVAKALGAIGAPESVRYLVRALGDRDGRIRAAAALSLGKLRAAEAVADLIALLEEEAWTVRASAIEALAGIGGREVVAALIAHLPRERGRLRRDCAEVLKRLTGQGFGDVPEAWERWWRENGERFGEGVDPATGKPDGDPRSDDSYYGIPIDSDRAIFVLDISESMSYSSVDWQEKPKPGEVSRLEAARREFIRALASFNSKSTFNVIVFNDEVEVWKREMAAGTPETKKAAKVWIRGMKAASTTNIYAALETAFSLAGMGVGDKRYDLAADTVYLLSDGAPTNDDYSDDDPLRILRAVREWNRLGRVRIHTIGLKGHDAGFMSRLALENGGKYVAR